MNLLFNATSKRELREGDVVRDRAGKIGTIIGFSLFEDRSVLVRGGDQFNQFNPNEVEFVHEGPTLEPLPPVVSILQEGGIEGNYRSCGGSICLHIIETSTTITLIPKDNSNLREVIRSDVPFCEAIEELLKISYVTRLPHLATQNTLIESLIDGAIEDAFTELEK